MNTYNDQMEIKYEMNASQSDIEDENSREATLAIQEHLFKEEMDAKEVHRSGYPDKLVTFANQSDIREEQFLLDNEIILPEASLQKISVLNKEKKKESIKSKKEIEKEEREKMQ